MQLFAWSGIERDERWRQVAMSAEASERMAAALLAIAEIPVVQAQTLASVPLVCRSHVINIRPLVVPVLVAAIVRIAVAVDPTLDSRLLPWLDMAALLDKISEIYRHLDDDEVDVFGAASELSTRSLEAPSVADPMIYPSADGIRNWFVERSVRPPQNLEAILESLTKKGALVTRGSLYAPSFLGGAK
jgi:hypothetical protein